MRHLLPVLSALLIPLTSLPAETVASFDFAGGSAVSTDSSIYSSVSAYDARSTAITTADDPATDYDYDSAVSSSTDTACMRAQNTPGGTDPSSTIFYHRFSVTIQNLGAGETVELTSLTLDYTASSIYQSFYLGVYSDAVGYTGTGDKLATTNISSDAGNTFNIDLTPEDGITVTFQSSTDLGTWTPRPDLATPDPDQSGVAPGFTRMRFLFPPADPKHFVRLTIAMP